MDKKISYTEQIKKFISGKKYAGKNIQTSDGVKSYITKTGIAKPYDGPLSNENGCTTDIKRIDSKWNDLGISVGSWMAKGQSCGNETSYVQSLPPKTTFDWKFYIESNPDLNLTTEQQAEDHWKSKGIHEGLLPNKTILSSMANVGKIGYVDINTTIHPVPKESRIYSGIYNVFSEGNVTGSDMKDCTVPPPSVKYGDQIFIKFGNSFVSMNNQSLAEVGNNKTKFYLRPPWAWEHGAPIKYGDYVSLAESSPNGWTPYCGWWGCKVGYINDITKLLSFGAPGWQMPKLIMLIPPPGTNYTLGSEIKYGNPFTFITDALVGYSWYNAILFGPINVQFFDKVTFTFDFSDGYKYVAECKLDALKNACNYDNNCTGFIHSKKDNTWQKTTNNSRPDMYKVTDTSPDVYMRHTTSVNMNDKSCYKGEPKVIDSEKFANYPVGNDFVMNSDQCNVGLNTTGIQKKQQFYNNSNQIANRTGQYLIDKYPNMKDYSNRMNSMYKNIHSNTNEYKKVLKTIKTKKEQYNDTYNQQNNDLALLADSNKAHVFAWGLSSIIVIAMVVMIKNRQT
jgi:hypothetical protein